MFVKQKLPNLQDKRFCLAKFAFYARQACLFCTDARQRILFCKICVLCKARDFVLHGCKIKDFVLQNLCFMQDKGAKMLFCARQERYIPSVCGRGSVIDGDFLSAEQEPEEAQHDQEKDEVQQLVAGYGCMQPCIRGFFLTAHG